jgi:hypothetical protein
MTPIHRPPPLTWYLPSFYGDIRLERVSNGETRLILVGLSSTEKVAVKALMAEAKRTGITKQPWASDKILNGIDLDTTTEQSIVLSAPISKVQKALEKPMKPGRDCLSVVRYKNGSIEQITDKTVGLMDMSAPEKEEEPAKTPAAAVTVAQPTRGCPAPDFESVEIRANRVLTAFLTPDQVYDFESEQAFLQRGADTGHTYIITSRNAPDALKLRSYRSLYDLTERRAYCVHDWTVPAGEEMLCLALFVGTPGNESYVRAIPDA